VDIAVVGMVDLWSSIKRTYALKNCQNRGLWGRKWCEFNWKIDFIPSSKNSPSRLWKPSVNAIQGHNVSLFLDPHNTDSHCGKIFVQLNVVIPLSLVHTSRFSTGR